MVYTIINKTPSPITAQANGAIKHIEPENTAEFWLETMCKDNVITVHHNAGGSIVLQTQPSNTVEDENGRLTEVDSPTKVMSFGNLTVANQMSIDIDDVQTQCVLGRQIEVVIM